MRKAGRHFTETHKRKSWIRSTEASVERALSQLRNPARVTIYVSNYLEGAVYVRC